MDSEGGTAPPMLWLNGSPDGPFALRMWKSVGTGPAMPLPGAGGHKAEQCGGR